MLDGQTQLSIQKGDGDNKKMIAWKFDQQSIRRSLAYMLIVDELPFKFVEEKGFKHFLNATQPLFHTPSRITMARDYLKLYLEEKKKVGVLLRGNVVDNASANDVAVAYLKSKFANWEKSILEGKWLHVRCTAHVMNLIVQDGLSHTGKSVDCVRAAVKYIRHPPQRLAKFKEYAKIKKCPSIKSLILDVPTRWNSTYLMLEGTQKYERAFARYDIEDRHYRDDIEKTGVPISSDWVSVRRLTKFLEHFYELTLKVRMVMKRRKSESGLQDSKSKLDRDVLAIPISTMASESVSNIGGRVLDAFRSSLTPPVVESLISTQDWFRENSMLLDVAEN
nr:hypothetical protein [Tanacetum cinerariifolium]